jgi:hypothetical protein
LEVLPDTAHSSAGGGGGGPGDSAGVGSAGVATGSASAKKTGGGRGRKPATTAISTVPNAVCDVCPDLAAGQGHFKIDQIVVMEEREHGSMEYIICSAII